MLCLKRRFVSSRLTRCVQSAPGRRVYSKQSEREKPQGLGVEAKKGEDFPAWYQQTVTRAEALLASGGDSGAQSL